jgi:hypothetical protein
MQTPHGHLAEVVRVLVESFLPTASFKVTTPWETEPDGVAATVPRDPIEHSVGHQPCIAPPPTRPRALSSTVEFSAACGAVARCRLSVDLKNITNRRNSSIGRTRPNRQCRQWLDRYRGAAHCLRTGMARHDLRCDIARAAQWPGQSIVLD